MPTMSEELELIKALLETLRIQVDAQAALLLATQSEVAHLKKLAWQQGWVK